MKITILLVLITLSASAQNKWMKLEERDIFSMSSMFIGGSCDGLAETLKWHYDEFKGVFPNANDNYWNPELSWRNKYANGNPDDGAKFFGSKTFLVWTTDGYHLARTSRNFTIGATFFITPKDKFNWKNALFRVACYSLAYQAGFHLSYTLIFK